MNNTLKITCYFLYCNQSSGAQRLSDHPVYADSRDRATLSRVSKAARLRVRIPSGAWMYHVCGVCCQVEVSATGVLQTVVCHCERSRNLNNEAVLACARAGGGINKNIRYVRDIQFSPCGLSTHRPFRVAAGGEAPAFTFTLSRGPCLCN